MYPGMTSCLSASCSSFHIKSYYFQSNIIDIDGYYILALSYERLKNNCLSEQVTLPPALPHERKRVLGRAVPLDHMQKVQLENLYANEVRDENEHQQNQIHFHGILSHVNTKIM